MLLEAVWLPLYEVLRNEPAWILAAVLVGPHALAAAALAHAGSTEGRARWMAGAVLAGALFALDLAFELWVGRIVRVATTEWELLRLSAVAVAVGVAPRLATSRGGRALLRGAVWLTGAAGVVVALGLAACLHAAAGGAGATPRSADAAVVLGSALDPAGQATPSLVARVRHAARLQRAGVVPRIVLTGGHTGGARPESEVADELARAAGVPPDAILREERSRTTAENVAEAARILRRLGARRVIVVTERHHAGRAMLLARATGLDVRPGLAPSPLWTLRRAPYWIVREVGYMPAAAWQAFGGREDPAPRGPAVELFETAPLETTLDHADLREAHLVWRERIDRAHRTLDLAEFYASNEAGSRLEPVIEAILAAATRGVRVRFLADAGFARTYPETLARLDAHPSITVRTIDLGEGVLHEKAFVVDGVDLTLGSQNFDWRALSHIQELGVTVRDAALARAWTDVFELDWARAVGDARAPRRPVKAPYAFPRDLAFVASPRDALPDPSLWDLPHLLAWIDGARRSVRVQLLTYGDDDGRWPVLSDALRRAAARGVRVRLVVSNWATRPRPRAALTRLTGVDVRIATIPLASTGFIPFARVIHAKYLAVDGARAWVGTSNWEREYFHDSRNVGLLLERPAMARRLEAFFDGLWGSAYVEPFDRARDYPAPRIAR